MKEENFACPNVDCGYTREAQVECPYCGVQLEKIQGEHVYNEDDETRAPEINDFNDDPDEISWYSESEGSI